MFISNYDYFVLRIHSFFLLKIIRVSTITQNKNLVTKPEVHLGIFFFFPITIQKEKEKKLKKKIASNLSVFFLSLSHTKYINTHKTHTHETIHIKEYINTFSLNSSLFLHILTKIEKETFLT